MYPKFDRSAIERHPVFCPSASSCSTSGSDASLSEPLIAISEQVLHHAVGRIGPLPHHLLVAADAARRGDNDARRAEPRRAPLIACRLAIEDLARQPRRDRLALRAR